MKDCYEISQKFLERGMLWADNFKKIIRVWKAVLISKTNTRRSLANEPQAHYGCFVLQEEAFLDSTAWLTCSSMAKLTADLNHHMEQKHTSVL